MISVVTQIQLIINSYVFQAGGVFFVGFVSEAFFGLKKASNWIVIRTKNIAVNVSNAIKTEVRFGSYAVFRRACFLPLEYMYRLLK